MLRASHVAPLCPGSVRSKQSVYITLIRLTDTQRTERTLKQKQLHSPVTRVLPASLTGNSRLLRPCLFVFYRNTKYKPEVKKSLLSLHNKNVIKSLHTYYIHTSVLSFTQVWLNCVSLYQSLHKKWYMMLHLPHHTSYVCFLCLFIKHLWGS